jgi:hypothetical protein
MGESTDAPPQSHAALVIAGMELTQ